MAEASKDNASEESSHRVESALRALFRELSFHISHRLVSMASVASSILPKTNRSPGTIASATRRVSTEALVVPVMPTFWLACENG